MKPVDHDALWSGVNRLLDRAPTLDDLRARKLHLLATARWRQLGRQIPDLLLDELFCAGDINSASRNILAQVRAAHQGPMMIMKGTYRRLLPAPHLRPYKDLDILVDDPVGAQRALMAAGFVAVGLPDEWFVRHHRLRPLQHPEISLPLVELHRRPNWFCGVRPRLPRSHSPQL
jgi:hypothetical protein